MTDHAVSSAGWLSGAIAKQTEAEDIRVGITIDQVLAKQHRPGHAVPVARVRDRGLRRLHRRLRAGLQLHLHEHDLVGGRDVAAADGDQPARRLRADVRPRRHAGAAARRACARTAASSTRSPTKRARCSRASAPPDRERLDDYLENVREIERRIQQTVARATAEADALTAPIGIPARDRGSSRWRAVRRSHLRSPASNARRAWRRSAQGRPPRAAPAVSDEVDGPSSCRRPPPARLRANSRSSRRSRSVPPTRIDSSIAAATS